MPKVMLHQRKFEDMIARRGKSVLWEQAQQCTCWDENSGQPLYSCKACHGVGFLYSAPIEEDQILVMSLALNKEFTQLGEYRMGDCVATIPHSKPVKVNGLLTYQPNPLYDIGEWDKITLLDSEFKSNDTLVKGTPSLKLPPDTLRNPVVTKVLRIVSADPDTGEVTLWGTNTYAVEGNRIVWNAGGPPDGTKYSVLYYHRPVYVVYTQLPQSRDQDDQNFPKKVVLRYKDVI